MYAIRVPGRILEVTFSEGVATEEALRAISQAFALAEASSITGASCDLRMVERGPGQSVVVAAALASRFRIGMRVAFIVNAGQYPFVRRIARSSGIREGLGVFDSVESAEAWLTGRARRQSSANRRHMEELLRRDAGAARGTGRSRGAA